MNGKQRARWMSDLIADMQRLAKHTKGQPEDADFQRTMESLKKARETALATNDKEV
jgi:hypothetical protein